MAIQDVVQGAKKYFADVEIKYKNSSTFMNILGKILFFNKDFMESYTTTIGSTIYFPSEQFIKIRPVSGSIVLLHELVHLHDSKKITRFLFSFLYLFPQTLVLLTIPLLLVSWKLSLLFLIFLAPIPAIFRMYYEKRAYMGSLYVMQKLSKRLHYNSKLDQAKDVFKEQFKSSYYYFMWPFSWKIDKDFDAAVEKIKNDERPFESDVFDMLDELSLLV